jgi:ATP-binding cassette subfamily C protein CydC
LLKPARFLVLDEPDEGLDQSEAEQLLDNVLTHCTRLQQTLIIITHAPILAQKMQRMMILSDGRMSAV